MSAPDASRIQDLLAEVYCSESRRFFATLVRLLGDFDLAEEALHDAFAAAAEGWPSGGVSDNPRAWLVSAGRFKAIDIAARIPGARKGTIEVRPVVELAGLPETQPAHEAISR